MRKRARVVEEVSVRKEVAEHQETVRDTVRHTNVNVEQVGAQPVTEMRGFETYAPAFRQHYTSTFADRDEATRSTNRPIAMGIRSPRTRVTAAIIGQMSKPMSSVTGRLAMLGRGIGIATLSIMAGTRVVSGPV